MNKHITQVEPTTTPVEVVDPNASRASIFIQNVGAVDVYLGKDDTVDDTGILLAAGASLEDTQTTDAWWAVAASGTGDLRVNEVF